MMAESTRINTTIDGEMRDRLEAWRSDQYAANGSIPSLADAARTLLHKGLVADGFPQDWWKEHGPATFVAHK